MQNPTQVLQPVLHLIFSQPQVDFPGEEIILSRLQEMVNPSEKSAIQITWTSQNAQNLLGKIQWGQHHVQISSLPNPLPSAIMDRTIHTSPWQPQVKMALRQHQSHLSLVYLGQHHDPVEKMIALYQVASSLASENLLGVVNEPAWTAHPAADFLTPDAIAHYRQEIPFSLWIGYVRFFIDEAQYWLVTRGHHIFDVPDLAFFFQGGENEDEILQQFMNIFFYIYEQDADVVPGDTFAISGSDAQMQFSEVTEYPELLLGPIGTLVIRNVDAEED
jgi:hypothetical protein